LPKTKIAAHITTAASSLNHNLSEKLAEFHKSRAFLAARRTLTAWLGGESIFVRAEPVVRYAFGTCAKQYASRENYENLHAARMHNFGLFLKSNDF
jgi:hypothetical protein